MTNAAGWLQVPNLATIPRNPPVGAFTDLDDVDITELVKLEQLRTAAVSAVSELTSARPGGQTWKAAHDEDVRATLDGKSANKLAKLLSGDPVRWVAATVAVDAFTVAARSPLTELKLAVRTAVAPRITELESELAAVVSQGWADRADKGKAWAARTRAEELLAKWRTARALIVWAADGGHYTVNRDTVPSGIIAGCYWSLCWKLDGIRQPGAATQGGDVLWPPEAAAEVFGRQVSQFV